MARSRNGGNLILEVLLHQQPWDVIVVGSGATGGAAAYQLTRQGLNVLVLEAGKPVKGRADYGSFFTNAPRALYRHTISGRQNVQKSHPTYWNANPDFFVDDIDNPYSTPEEKPFRWIRGRRVADAHSLGMLSHRAFRTSTLRPPATTAWAPTGPLTTRTWLLITRNLNGSSAYMGRKKTCHKCPTVIFWRPSP